MIAPLFSILTAFFLLLLRTVDNNTIQDTTTRSSLRIQKRISFYSALLLFIPILFFNNWVVIFQSMQSSKDFYYRGKNNLLFYFPNSTIKATNKAIVVELEPTPTPIIIQKINAHLYHKLPLHGIHADGTTAYYHCQPGETIRNGMYRKWGGPKNTRQPLPSGTGTGNSTSLNASGVLDSHIKFNNMELTLFIVGNSLGE